MLVRACLLFFGREGQRVKVFGGTIFVDFVEACLSPVFAEEKQTCTDKQAADDLASNKAHGHFGDCGEGAQNSGPNFNTSWRKTAVEVSDSYLKMMWEDEKALVTSGERDPDKKEDYSYIGHYLNMKGDYKTVACGIALSDDGKKGWLNINFFRK